MAIRDKGEYTSYFVVGGSESIGLNGKNKVTVKYVEIIICTVEYRLASD